MSRNRNQKDTLLLWQTGTAAIFALVGAAFSLAFPSATLTVVLGLIIGLAGLLVPLYFEFPKVTNRLDEAERNILRKIEHSIEVDPRIENNQVYRKIANRLLKPTVGLTFVKHCLVLRHAGERLDQSFTYPFGAFDEYARISVLAQVIESATHSVSAYTYADKEHLKHFWDENKDGAISRYYEAHQRAVNNMARGLIQSLKRVFVVPDDLAVRERDAFYILLGVIEKLRKFGMQDLSWMLESEARAAFDAHGIKLPERSFFLAIDEDHDSGCVSEGWSFRTQERDGYILFSNQRNDLQLFKTQFDLLWRESKSAYSDTLRKRLMPQQPVEPGTSTYRDI